MTGAATVENEDYWKGRVDERLRAGTRRFDNLDKGQERLEEKVGELQVELSSLKTKVAFYSAIGSIVGGGIVTLIVAVGSRALS